jgi:hypothetical protein
MIGCKLPLHPWGKDAHESKKAHTRSELCKQEEGGHAQVCKEYIRDLVGRAWINEGRAQGQKGTNGSDRGSYGIVKAHAGALGVCTG